MLSSFTVPAIGPLGWPAGTQHPFLESHVLFSASGNGEVERETNGRGIFTVSLFRVLQGSIIENMTYPDLINKLAGLRG